jgi:hypothetical protein
MKRQRLPEPLQLLGDHQRVRMPKPSVIASGIATVS